MKRLKQHSYLLRIISIDSILVKNGVVDESKMRFSTKNHRVSLRYCSALPVGSYLNYTRDENEIEFQQKLNNEIIKAQIYGVLRNAANFVEDRSPQRVFLMPLGTGVFHHDPEIAFKEYFNQVEIAVKMLTEDEIKKLEIRILAWRGSQHEVETFKSLNINL